STLAEPPPTPPVVSASSSHTRQILLSYGLTAVLMVGMLSYGSWMQTDAQERAEAISRGTPVVTVSSEPRAWARTVLRTWLPGALVGLVTLGVGLSRVLLGRKRPERGPSV
ncbi:MAG TPA: hypothetical protein VNN80_10790, partial [Polyangiaceae bacterium]|nr:hypothetical protein [Polyangiaceae bacterium]